MNGLGMIASRMQALQERAEKAEAKVQEQAAALARVEALDRPCEERPQMDAYYYGFTPTGVEIIDRIVSAVAVVGKAYHHTDSWTLTDHWTNPSHAARIQQSAMAAATSIRAALAGEQS